MISLSLFAIALLPFIIGNSLTKEYADAIVLAFAMVGGIGCYRARDTFLFLTPNALVFFYTSISIALGAWGFRNNYVLNAVHLTDYSEWRSAHIAVTLILISLAILLSIDFLYQRQYQQKSIRAPLRCNSRHIVVACLLVPFFFLSFDLALFGGAGDFSVIGKSVFAIMCIIFFSKYPAMRRWSVYLGLIIVFATFSIHNKREAIFIILPMLYLEFLQRPQRPTWKSIVLLVPLGGFLLMLVLVMSVARGYGGFGELDGLLAAIPFVADYIGSDVFIAGLLNNIEANYFFFHALNSIEMVLRDPELLAAGSTIVKPVFMFFPRSVLVWKPESIITLYTVAYDPGFRAIGGSWPISLFSELFWNFYYFSLLAVILLALVLAKLQFLVVKAHGSGNVFWLGFMLFAYMNVIMLARGSGIDLYLSYQLFAGLLFLLCAFAAFALRYGTSPEQTVAASGS